MILKSFGCSFIYGTDLADDGRGRETATPSQLTWPALLAKDLGRNYQCFARPGAGNLRILEKILNESINNDSTIFIIGWTWIDRFDYTTIPGKWVHRDDRADAEQWKTLMPIDTHTTANEYYRNLHSQYRDKLTCLIYIKTAIDTLRQKNIPFIMTYMDELLFETEWHISSAITQLQEYVRPHMTEFEGKTFLDYSKEKGFPISETLHPLEPAHQAAFELIKSYNLV